MAKYKATSFILHARPFKETSLLLNLFSKEFGRFTLVAKGIKRKNAYAMRAILQPFNLLSIECAGRGELKTLCYAELVSGQSRLTHKALACGYYMNELIMRSIHEWQEFQELFISYKQSIFELQSFANVSELKTDGLCPQELNLAVILRKFEVSLLSELGVSPSWTLDVKGNSICENSIYRFIAEQGFEMVEENDEYGYSGLAILCLGNSKFSLETTKPSQRITQMLLRQIIGDKPLESRKLWLK